MWISSSYGRKPNQENSLDKIKQFIKLTEKSSFSTSLAKSSSISSGSSAFNDKRSREK